MAMIIHRGLKTFLHRSWQRNLAKKLLVRTWWIACHVTQFHAETHLFRLCVSIDVRLVDGKASRCSKCLRKSGRKHPAFFQSVGHGSSVVRTRNWWPSGRGFESQWCRFGTWESLFTPHCLFCLSEDTISHWSLLSGVYARGSKRSHTPHSRERRLWNKPLLC